MDNMTAKVSCFARAYHARKQGTRIFDDTAAEAILGEDYSQIAQNMTNGIRFFLPDFDGTPEEGLRQIVDNQLSPSVLGRSAFCEDMRADSFAQIVLFASGFDTFGIRNRNTALSVYELDFPALLEDKKRRIDRASLSSCSVYVPCDLSDASWQIMLTDSGLRAELPTFSSLLGISYYLRKEDWRCLLRKVSYIFSSNCAICFDYPTEEESRETRTNRTLAGGAGEAMQALYGRDEMQALLTDTGFVIEQHLGHAEMESRYFAAYNAAHPDAPMRAPEGVRYIFARKRT